MTTKSADLREGTSYAQNSTVTVLNLLEGSCDFRTHGETSCSFGASYFMVNDEGGSVAACGKHAPDIWFEGDFGGEVFDADDWECDRYRRPLDDEAERDALGPILDDTIESADYGCTFSAALLFVYPDSDDDPRGVCLHHARRDWTGLLREAREDK